MFYLSTTDLPRAGEMSEVEATTRECYRTDLFIAVGCKLRKDAPVPSENTVHGSDVPAVDSLVFVMPRRPALVVTKFLVGASGYSLATFDTTTSDLCLNHKQI